jgi:hypothetical protein
MKSELFEKLGELHLATAKINYHKEQLDMAYAQADKFAMEVQELENKYLKRYKKLPDFY